MKTDRYRGLVEIVVIYLLQQLFSLHVICCVDNSIDVQLRVMIDKIIMFINLIEFEYMTVICSCRKTIVFLMY